MFSVPGGPRARADTGAPSTAARAGEGGPGPGDQGRGAARAAGAQVPEGPRVVPAARSPLLTGLPRREARPHSLRRGRRNGAATRPGAPDLLALPNMGRAGERYK